MIPMYSIASRQLEGITSSCCLLIGQHPHHMTLLPSSFYGGKCYGIRLYLASCLVTLQTKKSWWVQIPPVASQVRSFSLPFLPLGDQPLAERAWRYNNKAPLPLPLELIMLCLRTESCVIHREGWRARVR